MLFYYLVELSDRQPSHPLMAGAPEFQRRTMELDSESGRLFLLLSRNICLRRNWQTNKISAPICAFSRVH
jgi:hypothetical protein